MCILASPLSSNAVASITVAESWHTAFQQHITYIAIRSSDAIGSRTSHSSIVSGILGALSLYNILILRVWLILHIMVT